MTDSRMICRLTLLSERGLRFREQSVNESGVKCSMAIENKCKWKRARYTIALISIPMVICSAYVFIIYQDLQKPGVVVLLFHEIIGNDQKLSNNYQHRFSDFEKQLDYLMQEGYTTILPSEISRFKACGAGNKIIMLSFDDGTPSHYNVVYPMLRKRHYKGVFFVIAENLGERYGLSESQLVEMSNNGMEIGSHSFSHPFLDELGEKEVFLELNQSKRKLSESIGKDVTSFAPPGGWYNDLVIKIAKNVGYTSFFSCNIGTNDISQSIYVYNRIEVSGDMSLDEFKRLLTPSQILSDKLKQSMKFFVHRVLGSNNYKKLGGIIGEVYDCFPKIENSIYPQSLGKCFPAVGLISQIDIDITLNDHCDTFTIC